MEILYKVFYHYKNIPKFMQRKVKEEFMKHRNEVVNVFNDQIGDVNRKWNLIGKPAAFGSFYEDINPEYVEFVVKHIQPKIDAINKKFLLCKYCIDEYGDLVGYIPGLKGSKIYITMKKIGS